MYIGMLVEVLFGTFSTNILTTNIPNASLISSGLHLTYDISISVVYAIGLLMVWLFLDFQGRGALTSDPITSRLSSRYVHYLWSKGSYVMSNPFIQLILCPWLLPYLIVSVISINNMFNTSLLIVWMYVIGGYSFNFWIRDSIREYTSTYEILIGMFFMLFCSLVLSESLFFITFFWSSFHATCSLVWSSEGLYLPDPSELTFTNTVLLSNSGLSLGCAYLFRCLFILCHSLCLWSFLLAFTFISLQVKEFHNITLYMNESIYSCVFFFLTGLHLFHVLVGILLIGLMLWTSCYSRFIVNFILYQLRVTPHHMNYTLQLVYWHFVECLWLFIYYVLYN
jgi:heme/copper-type cytochrome/quinol oxidase subunit 3